MIAGLFLTVSVKLPGTLIILLAAAIYGLFTDFTTFLPWTTGLLIFLTLVSEFGSRILRERLVSKFRVSGEFSVNSIVCQFGGMLACDALLGSVVGLLIWELVAGKNLLPRSDTMAQVLLRLAGVAAFRFLCGVSMVVIIHMYIIL